MKKKKKILFVTQARKNAVLTSCILVTLTTLLSAKISWAMTGDGGDAQVHEASQKVMAILKGNALPILSVAGLAVGMWRTFMTQTILPLLICGAAGVCGGLLISYLGNTFQCTLLTL